MENLERLKEYADTHARFTDLIPLVLYEVCQDCLIHV